MDSTVYKHVLFCTDFSPNADFAFQFALDAVKRRPGCVLHILHVIPEPEAQFWKTYIYEVEDVDKKARKDIDEKITSTYTSQVPPGIKFEVAIRIGKDYREILAHIREKDVDLVVLGRQGHGELEKVLFGNVTEKVARKADCAVLIIPLDFKTRLG